MRALPLFLAGSVIAGCASAPMDVASLSERREALEGKTIQVEGRISQRCTVMGCAIVSLDGINRLSLSLANPIESSLREAVGRHVILEATPTAHCLSELEICTDRASELIPIRLVRYLD